MTLLASFLGALLACALLAPVAAHLGWTDRPEAAPDRKQRNAHVPLVGGAAVLVGLLSAAAFGADVGSLPWPALTAAFALGLVDDCVGGGLPVRVKFGGQLLAAALFALDPGQGWGSPDAVSALGLGVLALVAMNAFNLFDHADGLAGGLAALALAGARPVLALAFLGFLPFNTFLRRDVEPDPALRRTVPLAFLGDSGSHVAGLAVACTPASAWLLLIPVLDAVRVAVLRILRGTAPWAGDRRHLGHRIQALGARPLSVALIACALSTPIALVPLLVRGPNALLLGASVAAMGYAVVVWVTEPVLPGDGGGHGGGGIESPGVQDRGPSEEQPAAPASDAQVASQPAPSDRGRSPADAPEVDGHTAGPFADA